MVSNNLSILCRVFATAKVIHPTRLQTLRQKSTMKCSRLPSSLVELGDYVAVNTQLFTEPINASDESHHSHSSCNSSSPDQSPSEYLEFTRHSLISAVSKIINLAAKPTEHLPNIAVQVSTILCIIYFG